MTSILVVLIVAVLIVASCLIFFLHKKYNTQVNALKKPKNKFCIRAEDLDTEMSRAIERSIPENEHVVSMISENRVAYILTHVKSDGVGILGYSLWKVEKEFSLVAYQNISASKILPRLILCIDDKFKIWGVDFKGRLYTASDIESVMDIFSCEYKPSSLNFGDQ